MGLICAPELRQTPIQAALMVLIGEMALNMYILVFLLFGAVFGLLTFSYRHIFSEGPSKVETPPDGPTLVSRVMWAMVCTFLWPIMILSGIHSAWILSKRKRQAVVTDH